MYLFETAGRFCFYTAPSQPIDALSFSGGKGRGTEFVQLLGSNFDENFWKATVLDWYPHATAEDHVLAIAGQDGTGMRRSAKE